MKAASTQREIELFIVHNDPSISTGLRNFLEARFGNLLNISIFGSGAAAIAAVDSQTEVVVLENYLTGETGSDVGRSLKKRNKLIHILQLGTNRETADAIETYRIGNAHSILFKPHNRKILNPVFRALSYPVRKLGKEFEIKDVLTILVVSMVFILVAVGLWMTYFS